MTQVPDYLKLENQLCFSLYTAHRSMLKRYAPILDPLELTYPQYLVLLALYEKDQVPIKDLCQRLFLDTGTLTPLLKRMETSGWIERKRDKNDERQVFISLTDYAYQKYEAVAQVPLLISGEYVCDSQSIQNLKELRNQLQELNQELIKQTAIAK